MPLKKIRGATLIEASLALLLVSTGILGLLGLLHRGIALQRQQHWQLLALEMADELIERMQLNAAHVAHYAQPWGVSQERGPGIDCREQACSGLSLAQWDVRLWRHRWAPLPQGDAHVAPLPDRPDWWVVQLAWRHEGPGDPTETPAWHSAPCPSGMRCQSVFFQP